MSNQQILDSIDFIHSSDMGRGGYQIILSPTPWLFDDNLILTSFSGQYINPVGPFHKWLNIFALVESNENKYKLKYHVEFWKALKEDDCIDLYLAPFLSILRDFVMGRIDKRSIGDHHQGFEAYVYNQNPDESEGFLYRLENLRKSQWQ